MKKEEESVFGKVWRRVEVVVFRRWRVEPVGGGSVRIKRIF